MSKVSPSGGGNEKEGKWLPDILSFWPQKRTKKIKTINIRWINIPVGVTLNFLKSEKINLDINLNLKLKKVFP